MDEACVHGRHDRPDSFVRDRRIERDEVCLRDRAMRDGWLRRAVKRPALWNHRLSLRAARAWRRRREPLHYRLEGSCLRTGQCCETPAIRAHFLVCFSPMLRRSFLLWQAHVNGFHLIRFDRRTRTFFFRCAHYVQAERRCDSYDSRPGMCRDYPRALFDQPYPELLAGCGYRAISANAEEFARRIARLCLPPMEEQRLKRALRIDVAVPGAGTAAHKVASQPRLATRKID